jgi:histidine triad (HIT) family protein
MENCIFCKIAEKTIPAHVVWESEKHLAFLDIMPSMKGQVLVIPKKHGDYIFDMDDDAISSLMAASKAVAKKMDCAFSPIRTCMVVEGFDVPHVHVKLYPVTEKPLKLFPSTRPSEDELKETAEKIRMS